MQSVTMKPKSNNIPDTSRLATSTSLADLLGVTVRTVTDLARRGIVVRAGRVFGENGFGNDSDAVCALRRRPSGPTPQI
jgi:phage terminase Nu1 subunit (DNA packaging protein)